MISITFESSLGGSWTCHYNSFNFHNVDTRIPLNALRNTKLTSAR